MRRKNFEYKNNIRLKSKRLADKSKNYTGSKEYFYEKFNEKNENIFKKKWTLLQHHLKINRINKYLINKNINDKKIIQKIKKMSKEKKLKKYIIYNDIEGFIEQITDINKN
jgi:integrase